MRKALVLSICLLALNGCITLPTYSRVQALPAVALEAGTHGVRLRVHSITRSRDWSAVEVSVSNTSAGPVGFDPSNLLLVNDRGYDLAPLAEHEMGTRRMNAAARREMPDALLAGRVIRPGENAGGVVYFPPVAAAIGLKAFVTAGGETTLLRIDVPYDPYLDTERMR